MQSYYSRERTQTSASEYNSDGSALCEHSINYKHIIKWKNSLLKEVLIYETNYRRRLFYDSWFINKYPKCINRNDGKVSSFIIV